MPSLRPIAFFPAVLLAFACSGLSSALAAEKAPNAASSALPAAYSGAWFVTNVFPVAARQANMGDQHIGAVVLLRASEVNDVNGRRCFSPGFTEDKVSAEAAGMKMPGPGEIRRLQIACAGKSFATLLLVPGKTLGAGERAKQSALLDGGAPVLMMQRPEALYLLERAEAALYRQAGISGATMPPAAPVQKQHEGTPSRPIASAKARTVPQPMAPQRQKPKGKPQPQTAGATQRPASPKKASSPSGAAMAQALPSRNTPRKEQKSGKDRSTASVQKISSSTAPKTQARDIAKSGAAKPPATNSDMPGTALLASDVSGAKSKMPAASAVEKPATKPTAARATAVAPKAGTAIQLASYPGIGAAAEGWKALHGAYPELTSLKPLYVSAGKDPAIRLFATGAEPEKLRQICGDLQSKQAYCTLSQ